MSRHDHTQRGELYADFCLWQILSCLLVCLIVGQLQAAPVEAQQQNSSSPSQFTELIPSILEEEIQSAPSADTVSLSAVKLWASLTMTLLLFLVLLFRLAYRKRVEQALRQSKQQLRNIFNMTPLGVHLFRLDENGRLLFTGANPAAEKLLGVDNQTVLGQTIEEAFPPLAGTQISDTFRQVCTTGQPWVGEQIGYRVEETVRTYTVYAFPTGTNMMASMFIDITKRKIMEEELLAAHQKLLDILEFLPDATFVIDQEKKVVGWNLAMEKLTGIDKQQILGLGDYAYAVPLYGIRRPTLIDLIVSPELEEQVEYDLLEKRGECFYIEQYLPALNDGKGAYIRATASKLSDQEGNYVGAIETIRDISVSKETERLLKERNRDLDAFVHTISHDLRAPLLPIIGYSEYLMEQSRSNYKLQDFEYLEKISSSGHRMLSMLDDLLSLAKIGKIETPSEPVNVNRIIREVCIDLSPQTIEAGIGLKADTVPNIQVPETLLTQIFSNLIGNAIRYGGKRGTVIEIGGEQGINCARYFVRDHGSGISNEEKERIFAVFYRGSNGKNNPGAGVGLAIVQKIVRLYNGRVWVEETPGGGSTFWVEIFAAATQEPAPKTIAERQPPSGEIPGRENQQSAYNSN